MSTLDWFVMAAYGLAILAIGWYFAGRQRDASDYFLGKHDLPWWAVMFSIVATETSALSVISVPGIAARTNLTFLQLPFGYLLGRIGVALWLLPGYFTGQQETAYTRLEARFGKGTRRLASGVFLSIRALGDSVRVFATAIPLAIVTGWSIPVSVVLVVVVTVIYTWAGGLKAVVWVDLLQLGVYLFGALATLWVASQLAGGFGASLARASAAGKLHAVDWRLSLTIPYSLLGGLIGGALLSAASHGTDHMMVQRLLATPSLRDARRALVGSGVVVIAQFAVFLLVGTLLWAAGADQGVGSGDEIYPRFMVNALPSGVAGLAVAGLLAAAMSTVGSSLNSLASASTHDFYASLTGRHEPRHLLVVGRWLTLGWAAVLMGGALSLGGGDQPVVELALSIASITYGGLLGTYILGGTSARVRQRDVIAAILVASATMVVVVLIKPGPFRALAWPWYVPMGTTITLVVGWLSSRLPSRV
ncbi:MAG TPA: sodium:solute symporter [Gemmatimonadales bacterium]|jgi:SSS family transporter|nr:sodium:solute symporter [Gemmatimonadales bacterium]